MMSSSSSSPPCSASAQTGGVLESAAEQLMVRGDFHGALRTCDVGLRGLSEQDSRYAEFKASFCTLGIQALAEMNRWHGVLPWVLQQYECQEKIPAKILQMCILLYAKVGEQAVMLEAARVWLSCPSNSRVAGFRTVAELHLLHVLIPLGHTEEARELVLGDVGSFAFTEAQRQTALGILEDRQNRGPPSDPGCSTVPETAAHAASPRDSRIQKLEAALRFCCGKLTSICSGSLPLRRIFLAALVLYMLFLRVDPALPSSYVWISKLHRLLKQMWSDAFAANQKELAPRKLV